MIAVNYVSLVLMVIKTELTACYLLASMVTTFNKIILNLYAAGINDILSNALLKVPAFYFLFSLL